jgi:hypothetical protein
MVVTLKNAHLAAKEQYAQFFLTRLRQLNDKGQILLLSGSIKYNNTS